MRTERHGATQTRQIVAEVSSALVTQAAVFSKAGSDDAIEFTRNRRIERSGNRGLAIQDVITQRSHARAHKRRLARNHRVEHSCEREDVGSRIQVFGKNLFGDI